MYLYAFLQKDTYQKVIQLHLHVKDVDDILYKFIIYYHAEAEKYVSFDCCVLTISVLSTQSTKCRAEIGRDTLYHIPFLFTSSNIHLNFPIISALSYHYNI